MPRETDANVYVQAKLEEMRGQSAPLPLGRLDAIARAHYLRRKHYTYGHIAKIMGDYHGAYKSASWWEKEIRWSGCPPLYPGRNLPTRKAT